MTDEEKVKEYVKEKISDMKINGFTLLEIAHLSNGANIYNPKVENLLDMLNKISPLKITLKQVPFILAMIQQVFKDGAEFGYNKAFVEADKNLKAIVADFNKAKELIKEMLSILPKENIEGIYEITEEAEQFIKE